MKTRITNQRTSRLSFAIGIAMLVGGALGVRAADASVSAIANPPVDVAAPARAQAASEISAQIAGTQISSADLGVTMPFMASNTVVHLPDGEIARFTGPAGVESFIDSLSADFPNVEFSVTEFSSFGNLLVFDWQGTQDGVVVFPGRTLATVEGSTIKEIRFLNLNNVSPVENGINAIGSAPVSTGFFVIVDEEGNTIVPERIADETQEAASDGFFVIMDDDGNAIAPENIAVQ